MNFQITRSANGNVTLTKTTLNAIISLKNAKPVFSAQDVTAAINEKVYSDEQVTEKQIAKIMQDMAKAMGQGMRYNGLRGKIVSMGMDFYEYK